MSSWLLLGARAGAVREGFSMKSKVWLVWRIKITSSYSAVGESLGCVPNAPAH